MFLIDVPKPLPVVVNFYEQRLHHKANLGRNDKGRQYVISYTKGAYEFKNGFYYPVKDASKGTRRRTILNFTEKSYLTSTLIQLVHTVY